MSTISKAILIVSSTGILGNAYIPKEKLKPTNEFIRATYIRSSGYEKWLASEARKQELRKKLSNINKEVKNKWESYQIDKNTRISGITASQKTIIHCTKLMNNIAKNV